MKKKIAKPKKITNIDAAIRYMKTCGAWMGQKVQPKHAFMWDGWEDEGLTDGPQLLTKKQVLEEANKLKLDLWLEDHGE